jgi:hypothetical protein
MFHAAADQRDVGAGFGERACNSAVIPVPPPVTNATRPFKTPSTNIFIWVRTPPACLSCR